MQQDTRIKVIISAFILTACLVLGGQPKEARAASWIYVTSEVKSVWLYPWTDTIVFQLNDWGTSVAACQNNVSFAIDASTPVDRRNQLVSSLMAAKLAGTEVTVSYYDVGGCVDYGPSTDVYRGALRVAF